MNFNTIGVPNNSFTPSYFNNNLKNVFDEKFKNESLKNDPTINYIKKTHYLHISSSDRDVSIFPNVNKYVIELDDNYKNIFSIELLQAIIPDINSVTNEPFLILNVNEISDVMQSRNRVIKESFAILQMATSLNGFIQIKKDVHEQTVKYYHTTPKATLNKMTISILKNDGTLFDFGSGNGSNLQNTFVFKITTLEKDTSSLNVRNIYYN
jgi:hypothetical protein